MAVVLVVETIAIAVLGLLVCGLLRSHAEVLRALDGLGARGAATPTASRQTAVDLVGTTPAGEPVRVSVPEHGHDTLLAFLSSGCHTCGGFWRTLREGSLADSLPSGTHLVVVTKSPAEESLARMRELATDATPVVMSTEAWTDYQVPVTPYFVHVDGATGRITGQGSGATWAQVTSLLRQARGDDRAGVEAGVDRQLMAAGLRPGDPSLYPSRPAGSD